MSCAIDHGCQRWKLHLRDHQRTLWRLLSNKMVRATSDRPGISAGKSLKFVAWRPFIRDMQQHLTDLDARWGLGAAEAHSRLADQRPAEAAQVWTAFLLSDMQGLHTSQLVPAELRCRAARLLAMLSS